MKNNIRLKRIFALSGFIFSVSGAVLSNAIAAESKPNILVIMADDQGVGDIGFNNPLVATPVLDKLASESANFSNFIAAPACTPSRASFLTGRNHLSAGVWGVGPRGYINRDEIFLPEYLRRGGYQTAHFGKWEGITPELRAYLCGYDEAGCLTGGYQHQNPEMDFNGIARQVPGWTVDILADLTIGFIERQAKTRTPWYAITAYISPHGPWICDPKFSGPLEKKGYSKPLAALYGMVEQMDAATGRILATLDRLGLSTNTIVIYVSDNGPTPKGGPGMETPMDGADWAKRNPWKLRGRKCDVWENGIRVPFTVRWPGKIVPGSRNQLGAMEDILPTLLDLAGVSDALVPGHLPLDGHSLKPVLFNAKSVADDRVYFRLPIAGKGMPLPSEQDHIGIIEDPAALDYGKIHAVLYGTRFKFHHLPDGSQVLYDIKNDPEETKDVSSEYPEKAMEMATACRAEWDHLVYSPRRSFTMPYFLVGNPRFDNFQKGWRQYLSPNTVAGNSPLAVAGTVRSPYAYMKRGAVGFSEENDFVVYGVDVTTPGTYRIVVMGAGLDQCAPLTLILDQVEHTPNGVTAKQLDFGEIPLSEGKHKLKLLAGPTKKTTQTADVKEISFDKLN